MTATLFITHFWHYFYLPAHGPWYAGSIWGNVMVLAVVVPLGWLWSRTKFWPLRPIRHGIARLHEKADRSLVSHEAIHVELKHLRASHKQIAESHAELHRKLDALAPKPRVRKPAVKPVGKP